MSPARLPNDDELRLPRFRRPVKPEKGMDPPPRTLEDPDRDPEPDSSANAARRPKEEAE
jgi:hypothetical protein